MILKTKNNKKKTKNVKPYDFDLELIYKCLNCNLEHWLSLQQTQVKGFKVVCDCGSIFQVKPIKAIEIIFEETIAVECVETKETSLNEPETKSPVEKDVPEHMLNQCVPILKNYGFTDKEAKELIYSAYQVDQTENVKDFIKLCFSNIGS